MDSKIEYAAETPRLWMEKLVEKHVEGYYEIMTGEQAVQWRYRNLSSGVEKI